MQTILLEYVQSKTSDIPTQDYVESELKFVNANYDDILGTVRRFNEAWRSTLRRNNVQQYKPMLNNLVVNRNHIAHGRDSKITIQELQGYFTQIKDLVVLFAQHMSIDKFQCSPVQNSPLPIQPPPKLLHQRVIQIIRRLRQPPHDRIRLDRVQPLQQPFVIQIDHIAVHAQRRVASVPGSAPAVADTAPADCFAAGA